MFSDDALTLLVDLMGEEKVLFGTDFPFPLGGQPSGDLINRHDGISVSSKQRLLGDSARDFFGI